MIISVLSLNAENLGCKCAENTVPSLARSVHQAGHHVRIIIIFPLVFELDVHYHH
jgi:hypothetical protein